MRRRYTRTVTQPTFDRPAPYHSQDYCRRDDVVYRLAQ